MKGGMVVNGKEMGKHCILSMDFAAIILYK